MVASILLTIYFKNFESAFSVRIIMVLSDQVDK
jgi:hypothetical protein